MFWNSSNLVEGNELKELFDKLFGKESATLDTKWIRVIGLNEYTDTHSVLMLAISRLIGLFPLQKDKIAVLYLLDSIEYLHPLVIILVNQAIREGTLAVCSSK